MSMMDDYKEAADEYLSAVDTMMESDGPTFRSGSTAPAAGMKEKAAKIAEASEKTYHAGRPLLDSDDPKERAWMTGQFLAQAAAELDLATELIKEETQTTEPQTMRSGEDETSTMENLKDTMQKDMADRFKEDDPTFRSGGGDPRMILGESAAGAIKAIAAGTATAGQELFVSLLNEKTGSVLESAESGRELVSDKLDEAKTGTGDSFSSSIDTITKLILTAYDRLLAIVGKDAENQARRTVAQWIDEAEGEDGVGIFEQQLGRLYRVKDANTAIEGWVVSTGVDDEMISATREEVEEIAARYEALVLKQARTFDAVLERAPNVLKFTPVPMAPLTAVLFAMRFGLLTTLVYAGYDYIGFDQGRFLDIAEGVAQVMRDNLEIPDATPPAGGPNPDAAGTL